ncbi:hypothetical protein BDR05DRAFT_967590 [Suillus weaverae]|nr:hypothetical protein BDR05DRAFT_967590 [Suillus weaverae]
MPDERTMYKFDYHMVRFLDTRQPKCPDPRRHDTNRTMVRKTSEQLSTDHERVPSTPQFLDAPRYISFPKARFGPVQKRVMYMYPCDSTCSCEKNRLMISLTDQVRLVTSPSDKLKKHSEGECCWMSTSVHVFVYDVYIDGIELLESMLIC